MNEAERICASKDRMNRRVAAQAARRIRRKRDCDAHAYRCGVCGYWHVGSHIRWPGRRRRQ